MSPLADVKSARRLTGPAGRATAEPQVTTTMLCLLGGPHVVQGGRRIGVPEGSKRVLVFVALHDGIVDRRYIAGTLWPDGCDERAAGNLRSALGRLRGAGIDGLIVPRLRRTAVARNRLKRRLRELARTRLLPSGLGADVVIRVRPETYDASFAELQTEMDRAIALIARSRGFDRGSPGPAAPPAPPSDGSR